MAPQFEFYYMSFSFKYKTTIRAIIISMAVRVSESVADVWSVDCKLNDLW
jgi:hypothetical protein